MSRPRSFGPLLVAAALAVPLAGAVAGHMVRVSQKGRAFATATLRIQHGDSVQFVNDDAFDHQIYVDAPGFKYESEEQAPGTTKEVQFTKAGTFDVQCQIHPRMHLTVTVD